jgi:hypothetical protein
LDAWWLFATESTAAAGPPALPGASATSALAPERCGFGIGQLQTARMIAASDV